jgi:transposase
MMTVMVDTDHLALRSHELGALPVIDHFLRRLGVTGVLERYLAASDPRLRLPAATALRVLVTNLVIHKEPVYALGEWARVYDPDVLGVSEQEVALLNDDRLGRALDRLFDADRASMVTELVVGAIDRFGIDCSQLHNDSTTVTFSGEYRFATGQPRGGKPTAAIVHGHNKDYRPDLKQLLWILTISADGAVPIAFRVADGNTEDSPTHIPTWDTLVAITGDPTFLYVADCKLASRAAMDHIAGRGGRFLTVLPKGRKEEGYFREWLQTHTPVWSEALRRRGARHGDPDEVWRSAPSPIPSAEGYRIVWIWSSSKAQADAQWRQDRIEAGCAALESVHARVTGPRTRFHERVAVEDAANRALAAAKADRWVGFEVTETLEETFTKTTRGERTNYATYRRSTRKKFGVIPRVDAAAVAYDAKSDGCFPLITNDTTTSAADLLAAHKYQPNLEKRHAQLKGTQLVAPVFLKSPARIEALLLCHFIALLVQALIEREIRQAMATEQAGALPLYPEDRACRAPTAARVLEIFSGLARHNLIEDGQTLRTFQPELSALQREVLGLLGISPAAYTGATS